jgi:hypothetical protein
MKITSIYNPSFLSEAFFRTRTYRQTPILDGTRHKKITITSIGVFLLRNGKLLFFEETTADFAPKNLAFRRGMTPTQAQQSRSQFRYLSGKVDTRSILPESRPVSVGIAWSERLLELKSSPALTSGLTVSLPNARE